MIDYQHLHLTESTLETARIVVPVVLDHVGPVGSVLDLGGGTGGWCQVFKDHGCASVLCVDHPSVPKGALVVQPCEFHAMDLAVSFPPVAPYDMVICTELAEHLPAHRNAPLVAYLSSCTDQVLFSAAVPGQGGDGHVNEQPPGFWRVLFADHGFVMLDLIRKAVLFDDRIPFWFRQNLRLFLRRSRAERLGLRPEDSALVPVDFEILHTRVLENLVPVDKKTGVDPHNRIIHRVRDRIARILGRWKTTP